jgi:hypothetical protein
MSSNLLSIATVCNKSGDHGVLNFISEITYKITTVVRSYLKHEYFFL